MNKLHENFLGTGVQEIAFSKLSAYKKEQFRFSNSEGLALDVEDMQRLGDEQITRECGVSQLRGDVSSFVKRARSGYFGDDYYQQPHYDLPEYVRDVGLPAAREVLTQTDRPLTRNRMTDTIKEIENLLKQFAPDGRVMGLEEVAALDAAADNFEGQFDAKTHGQPPTQPASKSEHTTPHIAAE